MMSCQPREPFKRDTATRCAVPGLKEAWFQGTTEGTGGVFSQWKSDTAFHYILSGRRYSMILPAPCPAPEKSCHVVHHQTSIPGWLESWSKKNKVRKCSDTFCHAIFRAYWQYLILLGWPVTNRTLVIQYFWWVWYPYRYLGTINMNVKLIMSANFSEVKT